MAGGMDKRLEHTMFWTGGLLAAPAIVLAAVILGVALHYNRRNKTKGPDERE